MVDPPGGSGVMVDEGAGVRLARGVVPFGHARAVHEMLFNHGAAIANTAARRAPAVTLVAPAARWSTAPLLFLRSIRADRLTFVPVDSDAVALERAATRVRMALPGVTVRPCLAAEPLLIPAEALRGEGRRILFLPWWPRGPARYEGAAELAADIATIARLLGPDGCGVLGLPLTDGSRSGAPGEWPASLHPCGLWRDAHDVSALVLLEASGVC